MKAQTILPVLFFCFIVPDVFSQSKDPPKGKPPETDSLPFWTKPATSARQNLGEAARSLDAGVFLTGSSEAGRGTAWVISKKHRLLVTNAHVADIMYDGKGKMFAIPNGTSQVYQVEKVWYHPGVRRYLNGNPAISIRSMDPQDGDIDVRSPDLAVLQLGKEGPDLTVEFPIATPEELSALFAQPAAIFGYPGHDTKDWPKLGDKVAATYHDGVISRITDFDYNTNAPKAELQFLQYTMATWGGFSGSPVFLPNGHVVAVHNMARNAEGPDKIVKSIPHGVRVDCVLELLVHHGLEDKVPIKIDKSKVLVERWIKPDARTEKARGDYAKSYELLRDASHLIYGKQQYVDGIKKCNEAMQLIPNHYAAYRMRSIAIHMHWLNNYEDETATKMLKTAFEDAIICAKIQPSNPKNDIHVIRIGAAIAFANKDSEFFRKLLSETNKMLDSDNLIPVDRAALYGQRAGIFSNLERNDQALRDYNEAIRLDPINPNLYEGRARFYANNGEEDLAADDRAKAGELRKKRLEYGMKITQVIDGGAGKQANLRVGDTIVLIGGKRVQSLEELSATLAGTKGPVDVVVLNEAGRRSTYSVTPRDAKIGVAVEPVELKYIADVLK